MLLDFSITKLANLLQKKEISSVDLVKESYEKIEKLGNLNSFITVKDKNKAIKEAEEKDSNKKVDDSVLYGLPFSVKDSYCTTDLRTTAGSKILDDFTPPYNATVVQKLLNAGGILIGKNNLDAWGHGGSTENTDYGAGKNPWDPSRIPGGSSGGPAIAIATRTVPFAIGEDTGGSIRNPSSMCNISGLKVTYGRVSRLGNIAYASSLDSVGPMAKSVEDLAVILTIIAGKDPLDSTSSSRTVENYAEYLKKDIQGKVIGLPKEFFEKGLSPEISAIILKAVDTFKSLGARVEEVSLPMLKYGVSIYYLIAMSETSSNLARYDGIRYGGERELLSAETIRRIMLGTYALSAGYADDLYKKAQKARTLIIEQYEEAFKTCDILLSPVTAGIPPKIGELINDPLRNLLEDLYTVTINLVGSPGLAIPAGFSKEGLPVGMQLIGKKFHEGELFQIGNAYQQVTDWHEKMPEIAKK